MKKPEFFKRNKSIIKLYTHVSVMLYDKKGVVIRLEPNHVTYMKKSKQLVYIRHDDGTEAGYFSEIIKQ